MTRFKWLNDECEKFNDLMFGLSCGLENLLFFDSYSLIKYSNLVHDINRVIPRNDRRGVHLSWNAISIIRAGLLNAVGMLAAGLSASPIPPELRGWSWPLSRQRADGVRWLRSKLRNDFVEHLEYGLPRRWNSRK